ncbi:hypothetical protein LWC33_04190 [Pseudonocardia sp. RS11V-5]|uniref:hypothetical protein n=1 Tax=Pseudonocardia terrae TaxID=2905831 RepID=UPI001E45FCD9|nr:hypothetical protein [Pseudonocardia terrae]MCE3550653.1 hypothetical protein [Pseudonocardia terrae]
MDILLTRRKARRVDAARGVAPRPLREVAAGLRRPRPLRRRPAAPGCRPVAGRRVPG